MAGALRERILGGELPAGQQLPSERELCSQFRASRITVRRALQILEEELLIHRRQGSGTFVNPAPSRRIPILNTDFSGSVARHAPDLKRHVQEWGGQMAGVKLAGQLDTFSGDRVLYARRVDSLKGIPTAMDDVYLLARVADRLSESDLAAFDFLERWQQVQQIEFEYMSQSVEATNAALPISELLNVKTGTPILKTIEVIHMTGGRPAGIFVSNYRHDRYRLQATIRFAAHSNGSSG